MRIARIVAGVLLLTFTSIDHAAGGWVIEQVSKGADKSRQQVTIQANRLKTVELDGGRRTMGIVFDLDAETMTQIDYSERSYMTITLREYREMLQSVQKTMRDVMAQMSPEQRKMMEEMMGSRMALPGAGDECRPPRTEVKKTAQQATIAGYRATRYEVFVDGKRESEMWIAPAITVSRELDRDKLARFFSEWTSLAACGPQAAKGLRASDQGWAAFGDGYPVRMTDGSGGTQEVVKAEQRTIPATEFAPPAGFTKKPFGDLTPR